MSDIPNELEAIKKEVKIFLEFLTSHGTIEETKQEYSKVKMETIFENDREELYTILENLKNMSK